MALPAIRDNIPKLYLFKFLISMHFFAGVLIPFFTDWGGISFSQVMLLQSWFVLWVFLLETPTGAVADFVGRKASLACGAVSITAAVLTYSSKPDFSRFLLGEFLWAASMAFVSGADEALVYDSLKQRGEERLSKSVLARFSSCEIGAIMVSAPIGGLIASAHGLRAPMLCMTLPFTLALLVALTLEEPPIETPNEQRRYLQVLTSGVRYFMGHKTLLSLAFDSITIHNLSFMAIWLFQPRLKELGVPIGVFGFITASMAGAQLLILNHFERLEQLCGGRKRYLLASGLIPGASYLLLAWTDKPLVAAAALTLIGGLGLSRSTLITNYMNKHIESHHRATVLSSVGMSRQLMGAFLYPTVGLLAQWSLTGTFVVLGAAALACTLASQVRERHLID